MLGFLSLSKPKTMVKQWIQLLHNPTSFYLALLIIAQIGVIAVSSIICPLFLRWIILPSSIQQEIPLNLVFLPCEDNLHGICSFPTASLDVEELGIFSKSTYYQMGVKLHFSEAETNFGIGLFQNELTLLDVNGKQIARWRRTGLLKQPGLFTKALWLTFFPLYFLGFFHNHYILEIPLVSEYYASPDKVAHQLNYSLQDRFAQLDAAYLVINAKFGFVRNFLYYWPLTSFILLATATALGGTFLMAIFWGHKGYVKYTSRRESQVVSRQDSLETETLTSSTRNSAKDLTSYPSSSYDDYPTSEEYAPVYPVLENAPTGWNTRDITGVRNRRDKKLS